MGKKTLTEIVAAYSEANSLGQAEFSTLYQLGIAAIRQLHMDATGQSKTYDIQLDRNLTGSLPADFMNDIRVHVPGDEGAGLLKDNNLDIDDEEDEDFCCHDDFGGLDFNAKPSYGTGGISWIGKYKIDRDKRKILVNPDFCYSCVTLVYLPSAAPTKSGEWLVDELASEAVEAYIRWKHALGKASRGLYEKETHRRNWLKEKRLAKKRMRNLTVGQMQDNARSSIKYKVKI